LLSCRTDERGAHVPVVGENIHQKLEGCVCAAGARKCGRGCANNMFPDIESCFEFNFNGLAGAK